MDCPVTPRTLADASACAKNLFDMWKAGTIKSDLQCAGLCATTIANYGCTFLPAGAPLFTTTPMDEQTAMAHIETLSKDGGKKAKAINPASWAALILALLKLVFG